MTHSFKSHAFHLIWSTKDRVPYISSEIEPRLYGYLGAICSDHKAILRQIGGMEDHIHLLIQLSNLDKYSHLIRDMKAFSSAWMSKNFKNTRDFSWQEGFGSFTVSYSHLAKIERYIQNQKEHHKKYTFDEEFLMILKLHQIKYDSRFIYG